MALKRAKGKKRSSLFHSLANRFTSMIYSFFVNGRVGDMLSSKDTLCKRSLLATTVEQRKAGAQSKLLKYPEYSDVSNLQSLFNVLEEKDKLLDVITAHQTSDDGSNVYIGDDEGELRNTTLIFKSVNAGGKKLAIGIIGPKRMNYSKVIGMINQLADKIDSMFTDENNLLT